MIKNRAISANTAITGIYNLLLIAFFCIALYFGREFFIPIVTAGLLTFLFSPFVDYLEYYLGRIFSIAIVVTLLFISAGFTGYILYKQIIDLSKELPGYSVNIHNKFELAKHSSEKLFSSFSIFTNSVDKGPASPLREKADGKEDNPVPVKIIDDKLPLTNYYSIIFGSLFNFLGYTVLIMILLFFMLYYRDDLNRRFLYVLGKGQISATTHAIKDAGNRVSKYLMALLVVNIFYGLSVSIALSLIGIPNAALWGIMGGVLRFIPYIGFIISALFPILLSLSISADYFIFVETAGFYLVIELLVSYFIEPILYGHRTGVSPLALIIAAIFWTWIWGAMGLVLAAPLTVCLVVIGRYIPRFESLSILFGDKKALELHIDLYYRIIAGDFNDVIEFINTFLKTHSLVQLYDNVIIPMIDEVEKDYRDSSLIYKQKKWVFQTINDINNNLYSRSGDLGLSPIHTNTKVICLGGKSAADILIGGILNSLLIRLQINSTFISAKDERYPGEVNSADIICISIAPYTSILYAKSICSELRMKNASANILVVLWSHKIVKDDEDCLNAAGANYIVKNMEETISAISTICHVL